MKNLSLAFLAAVSLVSVAGCPKKHKDDGAAAMAKMAEVRDAMCKCADKPCADKVNEDLVKWGQDQAKADVAGKTAKLGDEDAKKLASITEEMTKCMTKAMTGAGMAAGDKPAGDKPAGDPANGSAAPAGDKPAGDRPAGDKPAGDPAATGSAAPAAMGSAAPAATGSAAAH
ncbi:MAG TPA: hypothetical protein VH165_17400 [Kofleriaceae bacterium]|nr:hypothetical protein [Kofleriaceae bacterium]